MKSIKSFIPDIVQIARNAGEATLTIYNTADYAISRKSDCSPVTEADLASHEVIVEGLQRLTPDIPIVSEEDESSWRIQEEMFWLIDPLDGTKEFINKRDEFTVNIALIKQNTPVFGVVYAPAIDEMYWNEDKDTAFLNGSQIEVSPPSEEGLVVMASRSHSNKTELDDFLQDYPVKELTFAGSSLKICRVATGKADLYPRLAPTMIWDTAAAHAVLLAAGGAIETIEGIPLTYSLNALKNPSFICKGKLGQ